MVYNLLVLLFLVLKPGPALAPPPFSFFPQWNGGKMAVFVCLFLSRNGKGLGVSWHSHPRGWARLWEELLKLPRSPQG